MNNQQISTIVSSMLTSAQTKKALNIVAVKQLSNKVTEAEKMRFFNSLELAQVLAQSETGFNEFCEAVKNRLSDNGLTSKEQPKKEQLIKMAYGFEKSYFHKLLRVGNLPKNIVNKFNDKCDEARANGEKPQQSIEALLTWAKSFETHKGEAETTKEAIAEIREEANGTGEKPVVLWQISHGNKRLKVYSDGTNDGNFTAVEINEFVDHVLRPYVNDNFAIRKVTPRAKKELDAIQKEKLKKVAKHLNEA